MSPEDESLSKLVPWILALIIAFAGFSVGASSRGFRRILPERLRPMSDRMDWFKDLNETTKTDIARAVHRGEAVNNPNNAPLAVRYCEEWLEGGFILYAIVPGAPFLFALGFLVLTIRGIFLNESWKFYGLLTLLLLALAVRSALFFQQRKRAFLASIDANLTVIEEEPRRGE